MRTSDAKFLEILTRFGLPADDLATMPVVMNRTGNGGRGLVTFYGQGAPIPVPVAEAIKNEVLPLIEGDESGLGASSYTGVISENVLGAGEAAVRDADFAAYCRDISAMQ